MRLWPQDWKGGFAIPETGKAPEGQALGGEEAPWMCPWGVSGAAWSDV